MYHVKSGRLISRSLLAILSSRLFFSRRPEPSLDAQWCLVCLAFHRTKENGSEKATKAKQELVDFKHSKT